MSTRRIEKSHIRKLTKLGGHSIGLTLPIAVVRKLNWRENRKNRKVKFGE